MADAVVSILIEHLKSNIEASLAQELQFIFSFGGDNEFLHAKLKPMLVRWQSVLKKLDAIKSKEASAHNLEIDIRDLVCRLEDLVDTFSIRFGLERNSDIRKIYRLIHNLSSLPSLKEFRSEVEEINARIANAAEILESLNILTINNDEDIRFYRANNNGEWLRHHDLQRKEQFIVGMGEQISILTSLVVDEHHPVICIYGASGIGKTTLARKLFNDHNVRILSQGLAWIDLDDYNSKTDVPSDVLFRDILKQLSEPSDKKLLTSDNDLAEQLYNAQRDKKCLIALDNMQSVDEWERLRIAFPSNGMQSQILFTTQVKEVASCVEPYGFIYEMRPLTPRDSLQLFRKKALLEDHAEVHLWKNLIGMEILEECKGIPSAIIATGELLATKHMELEWKEVLEEAKSCLWTERVGKPQPNLDSYDDLPYHLKPCFLYLGLFPKGLEVEVELLYSLWHAEGIVLPKDNETVMHVAEGYLSELVQKRMVKVQEEEGPALRKYRSCWVHERMQQTCLQKGREFFFNVSSLGPTTPREAYSSFFSSNSTPIRRLALHLSKLGNFIDGKFDAKAAKHLRSLLLFPQDLSSNPYDLELKWKLLRKMIDLTKFQMLRALTFERFDFREGGLPWEMMRLIQLRYLSFKGCILKKLPSSMGNLTFLLILDLRVESSSLVIIPNVLGKLKRLRHLYLPCMFRTPTTKLHLGKLKELEVLENFDTGECNVADLLQMEKLRQLSATVEENLEDLVQIVDCMNEISRRGRSLYPSVKVKNIDCYTEERHCVFRQLLDCKILHSLYMDGHLEQIPVSNEIASSLTEIVLVGSQLKEDPMKTLDKLPKLQVLVLQDDAYVGKLMKCSAAGFPRLKILRLKTLCFLERLELENGAMPSLSTLVVENCKLEMQMSPDAFKCRVIHI